MSVKDDVGAAWVVLHNAVDGYFRGQVVTTDHLKMGQDRDIDTDRLVSLGAIAPVGSEAARAAYAELGTDAATPEGVPVTDPVSLPPPDPTSAAGQAAAAKAGKGDTKTS